ncbi:hypothetical protein ACFV2H_45890 [Streptomyces sp. NPDC059629]|uniref:hypothetical protein n=1 Tax=Streptomyces sp. NPDC059629 TaxID=3346889 RepID=UPI0036910AA2
MNTYTARSVVANDRGPVAGAYLIELGRAHLGMHAGPSADLPLYGTPFRQGEGFPGVDDLLGIPGVEYHLGRFRRVLPQPDPGWVQIL